MKPPRWLNMTFDPHPIPDEINLPEGNPGLQHSPRPGVHADKDNSLRGLPVSSGILGQWFARIVCGIVNEAYRPAERKPPDTSAELDRNGKQITGSHGHNISDISFRYHLARRYLIPDISDLIFPSPGMVRRPK
jgi:hypothetical protein